MDDMEYVILRGGDLGAKAMNALHYRFVFVACLLCIPLVSAAPADRETELARENAMLKERVDALEKRMSVMQVQIQALMKELQPKPELKFTKPKEPRSTKPELWLMPEPKPEHPDWKEGQINGVRYYLIPISDDGNKK
jgi:hypothetical protein